MMPKNSKSVDESGDNRQVQPEAAEATVVAPEASPGATSRKQIGRRIGELADKLGTRTYAATVAELSTDQLSRYINGDGEISLQPVARLAAAAGRTLDWVWSGHDSQLTDEFVLVPRYDVRAAGGGGAIVHSEQVVDHLAFRRAWLHQQGLSLSRLALIEATGDSMLPTIAAGDLVLVALDQINGSEGVYVIRRGNALIVKRLQLLQTGELQIMSDNPAYAAETIAPERVPNVQVLGRVRWVGRNFMGRW
jgi:phage repressor protein C with HTH and peptisase S24 domain